MKTDTVIVQPGPGAYRLVGADDWVAGEASVTLDALAPDPHTDSVAQLAVHIDAFDGVHLASSSELTVEDIGRLIDSLADIARAVAGNAFDTPRFLLTPKQTLQYRCSAAGCSFTTTDPLEHHVHPLGTRW